MLTARILGSTSYDALGPWAGAVIAVLGAVALGVLMPSGACVIEYAGARGIVYRAKFHIDGRQVQQTLGRARNGWTLLRAERELGKLLDKVERERWRKPTREVLSTLVDEYLPSRGRRRSTVLGYTNTLPARPEPVAIED